MSKYIKLEEAINKMDEWFCEPYTPTKLLSELPTIEVSEDCISRLEMLELLNVMMAVDSINSKVYAKVFSQIIDVPSVVPKERIEE